MTKEQIARMIDDTSDLAHHAADTIFGIKEFVDEFMDPIYEARRKLHQIDLLRSKRFWLGTTYSEDQREQEIIDSL